MRFLTWLLGVFVLLLALEYTRAAGTGWTAVWVTATIVWLFAGLGVGAVTVVKLATGKMGAGALSGLRKAGAPAPAPHKEE